MGGGEREGECVCERERMRAEDSVFTIVPQTQGVGTYVVCIALMRGLTVSISGGLPKLHWDRPAGVRPGGEMPGRGVRRAIPRPGGTQENSLRASARV